MDEKEKCTKCGREVEDGKCTGPCALPKEECDCEPMDKPAEESSPAAGAKEMDDDGDDDDTM